MSLLGIDIGSTGCKVTAFENNGRPIAGAYREYEVKVDGCFAELSSEDVWNSVVECTNEVTPKCQRDAIQSLSVSSMSDSFIPIGKDGRPLMNSIMSFDSRARDEMKQISFHIDPFELYARTGMPLHPMHPLFKMIWLKKYKPKLNEKVWKYLFYEDFILWKLGAEPSCSYSIAGRSMLFNNRTKNWDKELMDLCGVSKEELPKIYSSGRAVGRISSEAAKITGLPSKTILVTGGFDQACCASACGVFEKGQIADTTGTNEILFFVASDKDREALFDNNLSYSYHVFSDTFSSFGHMFNAGGAFRWYRDLFYDKKTSYDAIIKKMPNAPTDLYFLPFLSGMGTPEMKYDKRAAFYGLSIDTDKSMISKAILEGVTMEMRQNIEIIKSITNTSMDKIISVGGATKSDIWIQLKANITGSVIESLQNFEPGAAGAAMLAGVGCGLFSNVIEAYQQFNSCIVKKIFEPEYNVNKVYSDKYSKYCDLRKNNTL